MKSLTLICLFISCLCLSSKAQTPEISALNVSDITHQSARFKGHAIGSSVTERGICYSTTAGKTPPEVFKKIGNGGIGGFSYELVGLQPATTYYVRIYAQVGSEKFYGEELEFKTAEIPAPQVITMEECEVSSKSIRVKASVNGVGILERGFCISVSPNLEIPEKFENFGNNGFGAYSMTLNKLSPNTTYYVKAYAKTKAGTYYGKELKCKTEEK